MFAVAAACVLWCGHNPDTSYARVHIQPEVVETRLTYDVFSLLMVEPLDDNGDDQLSRDELDRHATNLARFLSDNVGLYVDDHGPDLGAFVGTVWPPEMGEVIPAAEYHSANGLIHFQFRRELAEPAEIVSLEFLFFEQFTDRHTVLGAFRHGDDELEVTFGQYEPDFHFDTGVKPSMARRLWRFLKLGVEHIFIGYDHICFLAALVIVARFGEIVKVVTSFTIAHSVTLVLATLEVVSLPARLVEICIAATIVYVAVENIVVERPRYRWALTFGFGLIHGFGFASVLGEMGLPTTGFVRCLVSFNVGVELGQLAIACLLLPIAVTLSRWKYGRQGIVTISAGLATFGTAWLVDRVLDLGWLP